MICPYCLSNTQVSNTRRSQGGLAVWRRRYCNQCSNAFTTTERILTDNIIAFKDAQGSLKPLQYFDTYLNIYQALKELKNAPQIAGLLTNNVLERILKLEQATLTENEIHQIIYESLSNYNKLAGQRYSINTMQQINQ